ncbi:MAG: hypothetical protein ACOQNY_01930 [Mycoplasmoidaceae bacterium]
MKKYSITAFSIIGGITAIPLATTAIVLSVPQGGSVDPTAEKIKFNETEQSAYMEKDGTICAKYAFKLTNPAGEALKCEANAQGEGQSLLGTIKTDIQMKDTEEGVLSLICKPDDTTNIAINQVFDIKIDFYDGQQKLKTPVLKMVCPLDIQNWESFSKVADQGLAELKKKYKVSSFLGMEKSVFINGKKYETRIIGEEDDVTDKGVTVALTFQFTESIGKWTWGPNNTDFINSNLNQTLIKFAGEMQTFVPIKTVSKYVYTNKGSSNASEKRESYTTSLFPLAICEITHKFKSIGDDRYIADPMSYSYCEGWRIDEHEGSSQYDLFAEIENNDDDSDTHLKEAMRSKGPDPVAYWLRSNAWLMPNNTFGRVTSSGYIVNQSSPDGLDTLPCFCI